MSPHDIVMATHRLNSILPPNGLHTIPVKRLRLAVTTKEWNDYIVFANAHERTTNYVPDAPIERLFVNHIELIKDDNCEQPIPRSD